MSVGANLDLVVGSTVAGWSRVVESDVSRETRLAELVNRHSRFVFRVVYTILRNADDAEDVVQETFLKLFKNDSWLNMRNERAFLARTAWRVAVSRRREPVPLSEDRQETSTPESIAMETQRIDQIHALIDSLPATLREPLVLSALQDLTTAEIAGILDQPEGTVRRRISEARALLRQKLERMNSHAR